MIEKIKSYLHAPARIKVAYHLHPGKSSLSPPGFTGNYNRLTFRTPRTIAAGKLHFNAASAIIGRNHVHHRDIFMKFIYALLLMALPTMPAWAEQPDRAQEDARAIIQKAIDHFRGETSTAIIEMRVNRPKWQRSTTVQIWTKGNEHSMVRVLKPKKDHGAGNLLIKDEMWTFTPKINRVIKLPSSMMNQSWMGSDFTNNDIAKSDDLVDRYHHKLIKTGIHDGLKLFVIESIPKEDAPVVWGKEVVHVREDFVLLTHQFFDQDGKLVRELETRTIEKMSGRTVASHQIMKQLERPGEWTEVKVHEIKFGVKIPDHMFTLSNLRNPRN